MIVMGASLGGVLAVQAVLARLPESFVMPIAVVLHRHRDSDTGLVGLLQRESRMRVCEVVDKQPIEYGVVHLAPADYHLLVDQDHFALSVDEPVRYARPSIDVLFESAAETFKERAVGIVLTGGGADGARGAAAIEAAGGTVLVQSPHSAVGGEMPNAALAATQRAEVLELEAIAQRLLRMTK